MKLVFNIFKKLGNKPVRLFVFGLSALLACGFFILKWVTPPVLFDKPGSSILLDRNGNLLGAHIAEDSQWRFPFSENIPNKFTTAIVHFEDKRFWNHPD